MAANGSNYTSQNLTGPQVSSSPWSGGMSGDDALLNLALNGMPQYQAGYDPNTMSMTKNLQSISPQYSQGFNQMRDEALRKGPSAWLNMSKANNALGLQTKKEAAEAEQLSGTAQSRDQLASIGGLTSGARERTAEQGQKNLMAMDQDLSRQETQSDLSMGVQDESNRVGQLNNLTTAEEGKQKDWQTAAAADVTNAISEKARLNDYNMKQYQARMDALAANNQANATANSGKK